MKQTTTNYEKPITNIVEIESTQCFATSIQSSRHDGFVSNDGHSDDYWYENEVEL